MPLSIFRSDAAIDITQRCCYKYSAALPLSILRSAAAINVPQRCRNKNITI
jgi:hypothetical protein